MLTPLPLPPSSSSSLLLNHRLWLLIENRANLRAAFCLSKLQRVITLLALYFFTCYIVFHSWLVRRRVIFPRLHLFVMVHTKAAYSSVLCCRAISSTSHIISSFFSFFKKKIKKKIHIIVFMKCRAVRKARYFCPFP